jgi:hypothetical protein
VSLAKPPSDKKKKGDVLRKRELRMVKTISSRFATFDLVFFSFHTLLRSINGAIVGA